MSETRLTKERITILMTVTGIAASLETAGFLTEEESEVLEESVDKFIPDDQEEATEILIEITRHCVAYLTAELAKEDD